MSEDQLQAALASRLPLYVIHYACGDFRKVNPPPVIAIVIVEYYKAEDVYTFSREGLESDDSLLVRVFEFFESHRDAYFLHWNMNTAEFGFHMLSARAQQSPEKTPKKGLSICLSRILEDCFGADYIRHPSLQSLSALNELYDPEQWLSDSTEAQLEPATELHSLVQGSCRAKTMAILRLCQMHVDGSLVASGSHLALERSPPYEFGGASVIDVLKQLKLTSVFMIVMMLASLSTMLGWVISNVRIRSMDKPKELVGRTAELDEDSLHSGRIDNQSQRVIADCNDSLGVLKFEVTRAEGLQACKNAVVRHVAGCQVLLESVDDTN